MKRHMGKQLFCTLAPSFDELLSIIWSLNGMNNIFFDMERCACLIVLAMCSWRRWRKYDISRSSGCCMPVSAYVVRTGNCATRPKLDALFLIVSLRSRLPSLGNQTQTKPLLVGLWYLAWWCWWRHEYNYWRLFNKYSMWLRSISC